MAYVPPILLGFLATAFQIFLMREFSVHFHGNELTFGFVLASWLLWGGLGSLLASQLKPSDRILDRLYYAVILLFPISLVILRFSRFALGVLPGELTGMGPALVFSLGISLLSSLPLGGLFVLNARTLGGDVPSVYLFESLGAALAGLVVALGVVPFVSNWKGASFIAAAGAAAVFLTFGRRKRSAWFLAVLAGLAAFAFFDLPSQKAWWKPFELIRSRDTPYGKLQLIRTGGQISLYSSGLPVFSCPDRASAEGAVHFAMLQNPGAKDILLIGGGAGGGLGEVLKYQRAEVDYVELDPGIIRLAEDALPEKERKDLRDERVHVFFDDGRAFLLKSRKAYDAVILNLPEPATAQVNRFYTREFFELAKSRLSTGGVFSFTVPSSENYIGTDLREFLASLYGTLRTVFPEVGIVPGDSNVFLASTAGLTLDPEALEKRIAGLGLELTSINAALLSSRLSPLRTGYLMKTIGERPARINRDLVPVSYYFNSVLWSSQFKGLEASVLRTFARLPAHWLLDAPLLAYAVFLLVLALRRKRTAGTFLVPLGTMGFTTIVVELVVVIAFQSLYGYVYGKISLLLAAFMAGLALGSWFGRKRPAAGRADLLMAQGGFLLLIALLRAVLGRRPPESLLFLFLLALGSLGGWLFVVSNRLLLKEHVNYGLGYGVDLMGSFLGALAASAIIIPLAGIVALLDGLLIMNSFGLLFVIISWKRSAGPA
jgi:spermidine synthase